MNEKLSLWDRLFNRYRKEIVEQGKEAWIRYRECDITNAYPFNYNRDYVKYKVIDRVTGSETIEKVYLN